MTFANFDVLQIILLIKAVLHKARLYFFPGVILENFNLKSLEYGEWFLNNKGF